MLELIGWCVATALLSLLIVQLKNGEAFRRLEQPDSSARGDLPSLSILVPARDEEGHIEESLRTLLAQEGIVADEILVLDDGSTDGAAGIVRHFAALHSSVRLITGGPLPPGWTRKNRACHQLASEAAGELMLFIDADTVCEPHAIVSSVHRMQYEDLDLLAVVPRRLAGSVTEHLLSPLPRFALITFSLLFMLEGSRRPRLTAANGEFLLFRRDSYQRIGGHEAIRGSMRELRDLARMFRKSGLRVELADGTGAVALAPRTTADARDSLSRIFFASAGHSPGRVIWLGAALLFLFTIPPGVALLTRSFPWVLATLLGLWLRLRSDVRGGHSPPWALAHPLSVAFAVGLLLQAGMRWRSGSPVTSREQS